MKRYFGSEQVPADLPGMAAYYRARQMAAVVFTVDVIEHPAGRGGNDELIEEAAAFETTCSSRSPASIPGRGAAGVAEARRLLATGQGSRASSSTRACRPSTPMTLMAYPLYEVIAEHRRAGVVPHRAHRSRRWSARGGGIRLKFANPMEVDDVAVDFPDLHDRARPPLVPVAGRSHLRGAAQAERLHRPVGLVAEVLPRQPRPVREHAAARRCCSGRTTR